MKDKIKAWLEAGKINAEMADVLNVEVDSLDGKLKSARDESIERRKKLKDIEAEKSKLATQYQTVLEQLGIDANEEVDLSKIADKARGKTEADQQLQLKMKRLEADVAKANEERTNALRKYGESQKQIALSKALSKHEWIDAELVGQVIGGQVEVGDDGVFMKNGISLEDGITQFAKDKPHLLKAQGQGGSGYQKSKTDAVKTLTNAEISQMSQSEYNKVAPDIMSGKIKLEE